MRCRVPIVYLSDTGATPYGRLARRALAQRVERAIDALRARGATHILIACNAASTVIADLKVPLPVYGVIEPALAELAKRRPARVGVIGGLRTVRSGHYRRGLVAAGHAGILACPLPQGAALSGRSHGPAGSDDHPTETYAIQAQAAAIVDFYEREMERAGWQKSAVSSDLLLYFVKDDETVGVLVDREGGFFTLMGS